MARFLYRRIRNGHSREMRNDQQGQREGAGKHPKDAEKADDDPAQDRSGKERDAICCSNQPVRLISRVFGNQNGYEC